MSAQIPVFTDIGKATKDLLYGGKDGKFQFGNVFSISSKTADGVTFSVRTVQDDAVKRVSSQVQIGYDYRKYGLSAIVKDDGKVNASLKLNDLAPRLSVTLSGVLPDDNSAVIDVGYKLPYISLLGSMGLTAQPKVTLAATTGKNNVVVGGEATYDTRTAAVTKWHAGAGYTGLDYQLAGLLTDNGDSVKLQYAHNIDPVQTAGAEVVRNLKTDETRFSVGYLRRLDTGAISKLRVENNGLVTLLYEQEVKPRTKAGFTLQMDATNTQAQPKLGFVLDLKN
jgi:voltage-dependent anion channel protein 2